MVFPFERNCHVVSHTTAVAFMPHERHHMQKSSASEERQYSLCIVGSKEQKCSSSEPSALVLLSTLTLRKFLPTINHVSKHATRAFLRREQ